jgi:hypothetical protein
LAALVLAALIQDNSYWSSVLIEVGAAIVLLVPLLLIQQRFEQRQQQLSARIENVAQRVEQLRLDQLDEASEARVQQAIKEDEALSDEFERSPSFEVAFALMRRARTLNAISDDGIRISIPGHYLRPGIQLRLRFRVMRQVGWIEVRVEDRNAEQQGDTFLWRAGETADALMANVATSLQSINNFKPGLFQPQRMLQQFLGTLRVAIESQTGAGSTLDEPIIERPRNDWIVTTSALRHLRSDIVVPIEGFIIDTETGNQRRDWEHRPSDLPHDIGNGDFRETWETASEVLFRRWTHGTTV